MKAEYAAFLEKKSLKPRINGVNVDPKKLNPNLFDYQRDIVRWALHRGSAAIWADCGMGKTLMQLEWANQVCKATKKPVLILAPLSVTSQTVEEGQKFGIYAEDLSPHLPCADDVHPEPWVWVLNYDQLHNIKHPERFAGIVLDESSILKSYDGKYRNMLIDMFRNTPFRLACSATPAPNDFMELGNHSEFLGVMGRTEMLSMFFVNDMTETQKWRLKGHAESEFWKWICEWAVMIRKPSDLGYSDDGFILPELVYHQKTVNAAPTQGFLFAMEAKTLQERLQARRDSLVERVEEAANLINSKDGQWLVWCNLNSEGEALEKAIPGAVQVQGSDKPAFKEKAIHGFKNGDIRVLISKPKIFGFGMNFQQCHQMAFVGLSDSYEQLYQAVRRCWRFGQSEIVDAYIITASTEGQVVANIKRKEADATLMINEMVKHMKDISTNLIHGTVANKTHYNPSIPIKLPDFLSTTVI